MPLISSSPRQYPVSNPRGFTLIEVLVVMGIILILAGIVLGVQRGVFRAQAETKARAEMQAIANALEGFRLQYGDYPWLGADSTSGAGNSQQLFRALTGYLKMEGSGSGDARVVSLTQSDPSGGSPLGPSFLAPANMTTDNRDNPTRFLDPWGQPYRYFYKGPGNAAAQEASWRSPGFILLSSGPSGRYNADGLTTGEMATSARAYFEEGHEDNRDNLVHGLEF